ncbi:AGR298Cp [Eremothecium gossypii ATCC 10895]|uniref:AGR298Cp n=1 Tax=Eremothecium gossypii (strain ATCC 10895 / CBS 109.51 / FGSC 9923 / NRRL Y-1056) TaxID=284811 RepID=Q74ZA5_EREGS|nr:AGR298Cp [Eremothecium gossypii ATCC 10895]AAS54788.2 AGR298Cp [Eremothecium gossypii ATCC 10895]AEY99120.1 FAGR298Cp [Eremothecium gossypii FDAG1]
MGREGVPLIASLNASNEVMLLVGTGGSGRVVSRLRGLLNTGAQCIVVQPSNSKLVAQLYREFAGEPLLRILDRAFALEDLTTLGRYEASNVVDRVFLTPGHSADEILQAHAVYRQCIKLRIPINTSQRPELSTFSLPSTYRDPKGSGLQVAVTTDGRGCVLANRIRREIVSKLPANISEVVSNMGRLRDCITTRDHAELLQTVDLESELETMGILPDEDQWASHRFNKLVQEFRMKESDQRLKRLRWLSQIMEYYPLSELADVSVDKLLDEQTGAACSGTTATTGAASVTGATEDTAAEPAEGVASDSSGARDLARSAAGSIALVGSGPGSLSMLTLGALSEIKSADLVLADKLVPQEVMNTIPAGTETFIARKFPGNAERAQEELAEKALAALREGKRVVRLKQGDPYIFGRGGEEYLLFKRHGFEPRVVPGISSALAATTVAHIPATQRDVAEQVLICTGTGRRGVLPPAPEFVAARTTIFLMALHRVGDLVQALLEQQWDPQVPAAIVERASCPDQRVTRTTLASVPEVVEQIGSRPPGLLIVGHAVTSLKGLGSEQAGALHYSVEEGYGDDIPTLLETLVPV